MNVGRIVGTAVLGFFFLLFIALDLVLFGVVALNSVMVTVLPVLGLVAGGVAGAMVGKQQPSQ
ncbi:MAG TPA: hypothetical protein DCR14_19215 [Acidimicrobiaceae bacterium]|nr:hypothetical protein [Acidimicrobiaceae bacterium]